MDDDRDWVGFFDPDGMWYHLVAVQGSDYDLPSLDGTVSDPDGKFLVYVDEDGQEVRFSLKCGAGPAGYPLAMHERFAYDFGSPTLWWGDMKKVIRRGSVPGWIGGRPSSWVPRRDWLHEFRGLYPPASRMREPGSRLDQDGD